MNNLLSEWGPHVRNFGSEISKNSFFTCYTTFFSTYAHVCTTEWFHNNWVIAVAKAVLCARRKIKIVLNFAN
jgi:hypothetical protein